MRTKSPGNFRQSIRLLYLKKVWRGQVNVIDGSNVENLSAQASPESWLTDIKLSR